MAPRVSTVLVQVVSGRGRFHGEGGEAVLHAGQAAVYRPGETYAITAPDKPLVFHAFLTPRPG
ncbi:MAG TPA: AraC family ligand binding domain-containing protein [Longimicrobium sp.]|nr:AraC family ligand binding domain-containing protein [Longimicrobium sp.]